MGRRGVKIVDTLDELVVALCKDYYRREKAVIDNEVSHRTKVEFKYINYKICEAAKEIVGADFLTFINEIGRYVGYANTALPDISETDYKLKKAKVKSNIAKKLHLKD